MVLSYTEDVLQHFAGRTSVTIAGGFNPSYLGDERNLREFLVADVLRDNLSRAGANSRVRLFSEDLDPLTFRQLRVAVQKNPAEIGKFESFCGMPVADIPCPCGNHVSWAKHFEQLLSERLTELGCEFSIIRASDLQKTPAFKDFVKLILKTQDDVRDSIATAFPSYRPEKLFWAICPNCGYIDSTQIGEVHENQVEVSCQRCGAKSLIDFADLRGKLNWKLERAIIWHEFDIDVEAFSNRYTEPDSGSFWISRYFQQKFYKESKVVACRYGEVCMSNDVSGTLLKCIPPIVIRRIFTRSFRSDITLTRERILTEASLAEVRSKETYMHLARKELQIWLADPSQIPEEDRYLLSYLLSFSSIYLGRESTRNRSLKITIDTSTLNSGQILILLDTVNWLHESITGDRLRIRDSSAGQFRRAEVPA